MKITVFELPAMHHGQVRLKCLQNNPNLQFNRINCSSKWSSWEDDSKLLESNKKEWAASSHVSQAKIQFWWHHNENCWITIKSKWNLWSCNFYRESLEWCNWRCIRLVFFSSILFIAVFLLRRPLSHVLKHARLLFIFVCHNSLDASFLMQQVFWCRLRCRRWL